MQSNLIILISLKKTYIILEYLYENINKNYNVILQKCFISIKKVLFKYKRPRISLIYLKLLYFLNQTNYGNQMLRINN